MCGWISTRVEQHFFLLPLEAIATDFIRLFSSDLTKNNLYTYKITFQYVSLLYNVQIFDLKLTIRYDIDIGLSACVSTKCTGDPPHITVIDLYSANVLTN